FQQDRAAPRAAAWRWPTCAVAGTGAKAEMSRAPLLAVVALAVACGSPERDKAFVQVKAPTPIERAKAVRALAAKAKPGDVDAWAAVTRAARDPSSEVRLAAAESLAGAPKSTEAA